MTFVIVTHTSSSSTQHQHHQNFPTLLWHQYWWVNMTSHDQIIISIIESCPIEYVRGCRSPFSTPQSVLPTSHHLTHTWYGLKTGTNSHWPDRCQHVICLWYWHISLNSHPMWWRNTTTYLVSTPLCYGDILVKNYFFKFLTFSYYIGISHSTSPILDTIAKEHYKPHQMNRFDDSAWHLPHKLVSDRFRHHCNHLKKSLIFFGQSTFAVTGTDTLYVQYSLGTQCAHLI